MKSSSLIGIAAALFAAMMWSLNFVIPFVIGAYTVFDFALIRFVVSGAVGLGLLLWRGEPAFLIPLRDWMAAAGLAFIGYVGYFLAVATAAIFAGPVVAPAFLGLVPIVLALAGNLNQRSIAWRSLALPLALTAAGLFLINHSALAGGAVSGMRSPMLGIGAAITAVILWTWFGIANQKALATRPLMDSGTWTALMLVAGGIEMLAFLPVGIHFGVFAIPSLGLEWSVAGDLLTWGIALALFGSVGGAWAWTIAARRLPVALSAQLIVSETAFGTIFGLMAHHRWPSPLEAIAMLVLISGVVLAIGAFHRAPQEEVAKA